MKDLARDNFFSSPSFLFEILFKALVESFKNNKNNI